MRLLCSSELYSFNTWPFRFKIASSVHSNAPASIVSCVLAGLGYAFIASARIPFSKRRFSLDRIGIAAAEMVIGMATILLFSFDSVTEFPASAFSNK